MRITKTVSPNQFLSWHLDWLFARFIPNLYKEIAMLKYFNNVLCALLLVLLNAGCGKDSSSGSTSDPKSSKDPNATSDPAKTTKSPDDTKLKAVMTGYTENIRARYKNTYTKEKIDAAFEAIESELKAFQQSIKDNCNDEELDKIVDANKCIATKVDAGEDDFSGCAPKVGEKCQEKIATGGAKLGNELEAKLRE